MPTHTTITENQDGTFSIQIHDADALSRIQTMCDIIREDDDDSADDERALVAAYAGDLYNVIGEALRGDDRAGAWKTGADRWDALTAWLGRNPENHDLPWEYMGHDDNGSAHYRERQDGNRIALTPSGRLARIHHTTTTPTRCAHCDGTGEIHHSRTVGNRPCPYCDGTGGSGVVICGHCDGTGTTTT